MEKEMIYLASPYSHPGADVREARFRAVCRYAAYLILKGHIVYAPIAHTHPIALYGGIAPMGYPWVEFDKWFLERADRVVVLALPEWERSKGVEREVEFAKELGKPIEYVVPGDA